LTIVYVESNFVLEIALRQEQYRSAESILSDAEAGRISLAFPAFSIYEPFSTLTNSARNRLTLARNLQEQSNQLGRAPGNDEALRLLNAARSGLLEASRVEMEALKVVVEHLLRCGQEIPLDLSTFQRSSRYEEAFGLTPQDATMLACVVSHASAHAKDEAKIFANKNVKDFGSPDLVDELRQVGCELVFGFELTY
jgi:hypothetical protein